MSYGTDNDLSRPNFNPNQGAPSLGAGDRVLGTYVQGQGAVQQPAFNAPVLAPAATQPPAQHNYHQPQPYQPQYGAPAPQVPAQQPVTQPVYVPQTPLTPTLNQPAAPEYGTPPTPVFNPSTGQWELPQAQPAYAAPQHAAQAPVAQPAPVQAQLGNSYIETSINHLTASLGVSADTFDKVISAAVQYGDVNLINPAALGVQLTPEQTAQVRQLATGAIQYVNAENARVAAEQQRTDAIAFAAAGGQDQWYQAAGTFQSVADAQTRSYVEYLVNSNQYEQAAQVVINTVRGLGYQSQGQAPVQPSAIAGQQGLTSVAFKDAIGKLKQEIGNGSFESGINREKYDALVRARALGRQQGLA